MWAGPVPITSQGQPSLAAEIDKQFLQEHLDADDPFGDADMDFEAMAREFTCTDDDDDSSDPMDTPPEAATETAPPTCPVDQGGMANPARLTVPRSSMPSWLPDEYADICRQLEGEIAKGGRPACYQQGQFAMTAAPLIFSRTVPYEIMPMDFYRPNWFVWLPDIFHRIPCPSCKAACRRTKNGAPVMLRIHSWPQSARRVVDLEHLVFIVGRRYYCGHDDCRKTYLSWSPAILDAIPKPLAAEFRFHLTRRCGLTDRLAGTLRVAFQRGIGPSPFVEFVRTLHLRYYEQRHIAYLETVQQRLCSAAAGLLPRHRPFPRWNDPTGYAGYVPSHNYFRGFYDMLIEQHAVAIDQHMAMRSAECLSHDHSFKVRMALALGTVTRLTSVTF